jgi:hypothetical protein
VIGRVRPVCQQAAFGGVLTISLDPVHESASSGPKRASLAPGVRGCGGFVPPQRSRSASPVLFSQQLRAPVSTSARNRGPKGAAQFVRTVVAGGYHLLWQTVTLFMAVSASVCDV